MLIDRAPQDSDEAREMLAERATLSPDPHNLGGKAYSMHSAGVDPVIPKIDPEAVGLPSSGFIVKRTNGSIETDWKISEIGPDPLSGATTGRIVVTKPDPNRPGNIMRKTLTRSQFEQWQMSGDSPELSAKDARLKVLSQPLFIEPEEGSSDSLPPGYFNYLLDIDQDDAKQPTVEDAAIRKVQDAISITPQSAGDARAAIVEVVKADPEFKKIISSLIEDGQPPDAEEIRKQILENPELRFQLLKNLFERFDYFIEILPKRVREYPSAQKVPNKSGYSNKFPLLNSKEYTLLLALSMLDGTFEYAGADYEDYDIQKDQGGGQHRTAARTILNAR